MWVALPYTVLFPNNYITYISASFTLCEYNIQNFYVPKFLLGLIENANTQHTIIKQLNLFTTFHVQFLIHSPPKDTHNIDLCE